MRRTPLKMVLDIDDEVQQRHGLTIAELAKKPRTRTYNKVRREVARKLRNGPHLSWNEIGEILGMQKGWRLRATK